MKIKYMTAVLLFTMTVVWPSWSSAGSDTHRQAVEKLFELTQMQQKIDSSVNNVMALQLRQNPDLREHEKLLKDFLERNIGWSGMKEDLVMMYMKAFTEQELNEINAFYSTAAGKKLIQHLPELIQQRDRLAMQRMQDNIGELQHEIEARQAKEQP
jgi:hypothetical protein